MFSLQKLLGRDDTFFDLLDKSAEEARESVRILVHFLAAAKGDGASLDEFSLLRRKDKRHAEELRAKLTQTFVTPLEREDIEALSSALHKIPKTLKKFGERVLISRKQLGDADFSRQVEILEKATDTVLHLVKQLRDSKLEVVREQNEKLQFLEGEADRLMLELLKKLYEGETDPVRVIAMKDLYEFLEKVVDRCRDAGNVVFHIVLKNS